MSDALTQASIMSNPPSKFWDFSLDLYNKPEVSEACLQLQNSYGLDVNLILFCLWYGPEIGEINENILQQALQFSHSWKQDVVQPLRDTRSRMKASRQQFPATGNSQFDTLRDHIKLNELAAENYQQQILEAYALADKPTSEKTGFEVADGNLNRFLAAVGIQREAPMNGLLLKIAHALNSV